MLAWRLVGGSIFWGLAVGRVSAPALPSLCWAKTTAARCLRSQAAWKKSQPGASVSPAEYPAQAGEISSAIGQLRSWCIHGPHEEAAPTSILRRLHSLE